jgi:cytochrome c-type biogenesis protein CcmH/NrfF
MKNFKKYLPSKNFFVIVLFIAVVLILIFTTRLFINFFKNKEINKNNPTQLTVGSIIQKDSNNNEIPDWEEYLWGLDPYTKGKENKAFIMSKKESGIQRGLYSVDDSESITENAMLSRQFFATIMSLQQTGQVDEETIQSLSESIGKEIKTTPLKDTYTKEMLNIKADSVESDTAYFVAFANLFKKYENRDIGKELTLISQGIVNHDQQALYSVASIISAYREFSEELIKIPVPSSAAMTHLSLANNYEKTAQSIEGLMVVISEPIIGMRSLLNYKKYTDNIKVDFDVLSKALQ